MLHACDILFSGCVRARFLAHPNKALIGDEDESRGCVEVPVLLPAAPVRRPEGGRKTSRARMQDTGGWRGCGVG